MALVEIWHNPRCSKSRQTLALLEERGVNPSIRTYLDRAPSQEELRAVLGALGLNAPQIIRTGEKIYKELNLSKDTPKDVLIAAMCAHPILIERPIVVTGGQARLGRPPETVLELL